jgi:hypothetical protein
MDYQDDSPLEFSDEDIGWETDDSEKAVNCLAIIKNLDTKETPTNTNEPDVFEQYTTQMQTTDVILAIQPRLMELIITWKKNHNFQKYELPWEVEHIWFYVTEPVN